MGSNWELSHSGIYVKDFDKTVQYYQALSLAPVLPRAQSPFNASDKTVEVFFGKVRPPRDPKARYFLQLIYIGDLELEVLNLPAEPPKGDALAYRDGVNHVCFNVPDIDSESNKLMKKGMPLILDVIRNEVRIEDYLDTREFGNVLLSLRGLQTEEMKARKAGYGIVNWKFQGHSVVVKDIDKTAKYYESMGIAAIKPEAVFDSGSMTGVKVYGQAAKSAIKAKTRTAQIGPVAFEFIQPIEGEGIYKEHLDRNGDGIIDLVFTVDDLEKETANLVKKGVRVIFSGKPKTGGAFAYFDTRQESGDTMIKLIQH